MRALKSIIRFVLSFSLGSLVFGEIDFWMGQRRFLNVIAPRTFNEVLFMQKVKDASPLRRRITDKESVKGFISERLGPSYAVPTLAVLRTNRDIDLFEFPPFCVAKGAHLSQAVIIKAGDSVTTSERALMKHWLGTDYFLLTGERNYKGLAPKVIVEPLLGGTDRPPADYKVFCFGERLTSSRSTSIVSEITAKPSTG